MVKYSISNWRLLLGSLLGFIGALVIAADRFPPIHRQVDQLGKWRDIASAVKDLNTFDYKASDSQMMGYLDARDRGFSDLVAVIKDNRTDLQDSTIVAIVMNAPIEVGGVPSTIVHVAFKDNLNTMPLTTAFIFYEWIARERERYFLKIGLVFITLAFSWESLAEFRSVHSADYML